MVIGVAMAVHIVQPMRSYLRRGNSRLTFLFALLCRPAQELLVKPDLGWLLTSLVSLKQIENLFGRLAQNHLANRVPISEFGHLIAEFA